jgi:hypothetical protein
MNYLFNQYCFPSLEAALDVAKSLPPYGCGSGLCSFTSATAQTNTATEATYLFLFTLDTGQATFPVNVDMVFPVCDYPGPITSFNGLTVTDSAELASLVVAVWVLAWAFKVLRRTL